MSLVALTAPPPSGILPLADVAADVAIAASVCAAAAAVALGVRPS